MLLLAATLHAITATACASQGRHVGHCPHGRAWLWCANPRAPLPDFPIALSRDPCPRTKLRCLCLDSLQHCLAARTAACSGSNILASYWRQKADTAAFLRSVAYHMMSCTHRICDLQRAALRPGFPRGLQPLPLSSSPQLTACIHVCCQLCRRRTAGINRFQ